MPGRHHRGGRAGAGARADRGGARRRVGDTPPLRYHFHNTRNTGFANAFAAVLDGVQVLDSSAGGIGGCPFAPKATGNIATDDLVYLLERMGLGTGFDLGRLLPTAAYLSDQLGHEVPALLPAGRAASRRPGDRRDTARHWTRPPPAATMIGLTNGR